MILLDVRIIFGINYLIQAEEKYPEGTEMPTTMTSKGQITVPKHLRDAMGLEPGCKVDFETNDEGKPILVKCGPPEESSPDRFDEVLGTADIKWRTDELMALLRGDD